MKKVFFLYLIIILFSCNSFPEENKNTESKRLSFINTAYRYLKTPYKYAGTDEQGMDCSGLIYRSALKSANISLPRSAAGIASFVERIKDADIQPGDLLFFNTVGKKISHVGLYIGNKEFIHSASQGASTGVIISSLNEKYWKNCYRFAGRLLPKEAIFDKKEKAKK